MSFFRSGHKTYEPLKELPANGLPPYNLDRPIFLEHQLTRSHSPRDITL